MRRTVARSEKRTGVSLNANNQVQTVVDQQGSGRVVHKPDGTIVWEPLLTRGSPSLPGKGGVTAGRLSNALETAGWAVLAVSGVVASTSTIQQVHQAHRLGIPITSSQLTSAVAHTVASTLAGMITGTILGPVRAVTTVAAFMVRPVLGGLVLHQGVMWARRSLMGVMGLIRKLQSGNCMVQLEAVGAIITRALSSDKFRQEFCRFRGVELLLKMISEALVEAAGTSGVVPGVLPAGTGSATAAAATSSPLLQLLAKALEVLLRNQECRDSCITAGGVPVILKLLSCASAPVLNMGMSTLSQTTYSKCSSPTHAQSSDSSDSISSKMYAATPRLAIHHEKVPATLASSAITLQELSMSCLSHLSTHPAAKDAIREAKGMPLIVSLLSSKSEPSAGHHIEQAMVLLQALAVDPRVKDDLGRAGAVPALLEVIISAGPQSPVHSDALVVLHSLLKGSRNNQLALAQVPGSFSQLRTVVAALGPSWLPCKSDIHGLLTVLSRFPPDMPCHVLQEDPASLGGDMDTQKQLYQDEDRPCSPTCSTGSFIECDREGL
ncbi:hypothetical protein CEUSTIGMA_g1536.t1 [Chlamydomonas eustigma]|uniref:Armadillo repeat-containing domain-containing protein n=1 Tax=Chlamydomonas eustigma TaxID=1157962 RepID=A0A250WTK7_9CHLO|nr:hypothetical protein CEUSTIGMA_g1536.t1 [Chlamydomonas eustigma]|eukprot:GAX74086.1 hypothetical protein CEUSTIGMA_g1536.t1 [Chlamydomonas eustigma]